MCQVYRDGRIFDSLDNLVRFRMQTSRDDGHKHFAYRGHADENWRLVPRLFRASNQHPELEKQSFINNRMTSWQFMSDLLDSNVLPRRQDLTYLQLLAIAQHYPEYPSACGTELLDFSWSLRVAASFAFSTISQDQVGVIYILHPPEVKELLLGVVDEVELPDFFMRPKKQKAVFLRQFSPSVNEPALFDKYYFLQTGIWPSSLGPEFTQDYLLASSDDSVLRFAQDWVPHVAPRIGEFDLRYLLETEYHFLGLCTRPKNAIWAWMDTIQEAIFHLSQGHAQRAESLLSTIKIECVEDALHDKALSQDVLVIIELCRSMSLRLQGDWVGAEKRIQSLLSIVESSDTKAVLYNELGNLYGKASRFQEALAAYESADCLHPSDLVTVFNVATALKSMGRCAESLEKLNKIVFEIDGEDSLSWSERANTLNNLMEFRLAVDSAERAIELDSDLAYAWGHKGVALIGLGEFGEAADCFRRMLRLRPQNDWALFNLSVALHYLGQRDESLRILQQLKKVNPKYPRLDVLTGLIGV